MVKVSGVPYEVDLPDMVSELERENFMLRARTERLEDELRTSNELLAKLNIELINERNNNASRKP
jgi:chaperonin cofactor prefoldin